MKYQFSRRALWDGVNIIVGEDCWVAGSQRVLFFKKKKKGSAYVLLYISDFTGYDGWTYFLFFLIYSKYNQSKIIPKKFHIYITSNKA